MKNNYKISIIMPIFNAEKALTKTINSIINQTIGFQNLELILVDDKSTDNSKMVIEEYAKKYDNIVPIYLPKNSGKPGHGRNMGIEAATSDYLMFIDSDDEYKNDICETLYTTIIDENCDLVGCNFIKIDKLSKIPHKLDGKDEKIYIYPEDAIYYSDLFVWNKIFKKSIIINNNIRYITDKVGEDTIFCMDYYLKTDLMVHLNNYYGYFYNDAQDSYSSETITWLLNVIDHNYDILNKFKEELVDVDMDKFFKVNINYLIYCSTCLKEYNWKSLYELVNELYKLEKFAGYTGSYEKRLFYKIINKFIITKHLKIATLIIYILNIFRRNTFILKLYRRLLKIGK